MTVAALFVEKHGVYSNLDDVEVWDKDRDARLYAGPHPVVAHPPCERWGRYWSDGPSAKERKGLGDDGGCFAAALDAVDRFGGVLEHPEASHAFKYFGLDRPQRGIGWQLSTPWLRLKAMHEARWGYVCCVEQGHYGHPARKATWLYACGIELPMLKWGPSSGRRLDEGFHSKAERDAARAAGRKPIPRLSKAQNLATPIPFRDVLLDIARSAQRRAA